MGIVRAEAIARARKFIREGVSASKWITQMKARGISYRRTDMLADYRSEFNIKQKKDLMRYVRKDRYPTEKSIAAVTYEMSKEFMYSVQVKSILKAGEPITERFVNIMSDVPMTPAMVESEVMEQWQQWEKYAVEAITALQVWTAYRTVGL
ncbi:hypothetical protein ES703_100169 [subsurface metagenome]